MLMGIVTKNSILLVDYAILAREGHNGDDGRPELSLADGDCGDWWAHDLHAAQSAGGAGRVYLH